MLFKLILLTTDLKVKDKSSSEDYLQKGFDDKNCQSALNWFIAKQTANCCLRNLVRY